MSSSKRKLVFSNEEKKKKKVSTSALSDYISLLIDYEAMNQSSPYAHMDGLLEVVNSIGKGEVGMSDDFREGEKDNVVVDEYDKLSKMVKNKIVTREGVNDIVTIDGGGVCVDDVEFDKSSKVVKSKEKGKLGIRDARHGKKDDRTVDHVYKLSKMVKNKGNGKIASRDGHEGENDDVDIDGDVYGNKGLEVVKQKGEFVIGDGQNVKEVDVILDDVNGRKSSKVFENKKKGQVVICDGQIDKQDAVVVEDVVARDNQNVAVVVDEVLANKNVSGEVNKKDLKYFTSMYPELSKVLEFETLSMMPQQIKKNYVMDIFNSMGREKANILDEKWADLRLMELELHAKKLGLSNTQINLILESVRR